LVLKAYLLKPHRGHDPDLAAIAIGIVVDLWLAFSAPGVSGVGKAQSSPLYLWAPGR
jgi:hypothetical protein